MPLIYAASAWFSLRFPAGAIYFDTFRECYEAYVIYNFMRFLLNYLSERCDIVLCTGTEAAAVSLLPFSLDIAILANGYNFLLYCKLGVLQYTVIMPILTAIAFICESLDVYNEGTFDFVSAWSYLVIVANLSQIWAMYCLILFYQACKEELQPMSPISKFLCVKLVVFASFWQSIAIAIFVNVGLAKHQSAIPESDFKSVSTGLQDIMICGEMVLAAIAHHFAFSYVPYIDLAAPQVPCCHSFWTMLDVRDVSSDVIEHAKVVGSQIRGGRPPPVNRGSDERSRLIDSDRVPSVSSNEFQPSDPLIEASAVRRNLSTPATPDEVFDEEERSVLVRDPMHMPGGIRIQSNNFLPVELAKAKHPEVLSTEVSICAALCRTVMVSAALCRTVMESAALCRTVMESAALCRTVMEIRTKS
ncbi:Transmembrane protein 184C [Hypsibius exemplaris]|uniref:Transmembrane protein 184C n=1 Tax=Hypsibius exemplaris TaxID=2072580 RepID=A0A1W0X2P2_HYPEX|nr:Transmembrane protein 184C [Hypsibius exemplaris]